MYFEHISRCVLPFVHTTMIQKKKRIVGFRIFSSFSLEKMSSSKPLTDGYFKIVQTINDDDGKPSLTTVPCNWHIELPDGKEILFWPTNVRNNGTLQRNANSEPGTADEGWERFLCRLKRTDIPSFELSLAKLKDMSKFSDTSSSSECESRKQMPPPPHPAPKKIFPAVHASANALINCRQRRVVTSITSSILNDADLNQVLVSVFAAAYFKRSIIFAPFEIFCHL